MEHSDSPNGDFRAAFAFTSEQRERMEQRTEADCDIGTTDMFKSVAVVSGRDGDHVVVAMGSQGALHRSPDGRWTRVAVLNRKPVSLGGPSWLRDLSLAPLVLIILSPIPLVLAWRRRGRARGFAALAAAAGGSFLVLSLGGGLIFFGLDYVIAGPLITLLALCTFAASVVLAMRREQPKPGGSSRTT